MTIAAISSSLETLSTFAAMSAAAWTAGSAALRHRFMPAPAGATLGPVLRPRPEQDDAKGGLRVYMGISRSRGAGDEDRLDQIRAHLGHEPSPEEIEALTTPKEGERLVDLQAAQEAGQSPTQERDRISNALRGLFGNRNG